MKRLLILLSVTILVAAGCIGPKSASPITQNVSSQNTTPVPPWPNIEVFADATVPINVSVGQEFIIRYDHFASFNVEFQTPDVVLLQDKQFIVKPGPFPDGTTWFLFEAVSAGSTNAAITETTRFGDPGPRKAFMVNVFPSAGGSSLNATTLAPATPTPVLITPSNGLTDASVTTSFFWVSHSGETYDFQLSIDSNFSTTVVSEKNLTSNTYVLTSPLSTDTTYYWRVRARTPGTLSSPWATASFTTMHLVVATQPDVVSLVKI